MTAAMDSVVILDDPPRAPRAHPAVFSGESVRGILAGTKTQTRRVLKRHRPWCDVCWNNAVPHNGSAAVFGGPCYLRVPFCEENEEFGERIRPRWWKGDTIWVRETWYDDDMGRDDLHRPTEPDLNIYYRADGEAPEQFEQFDSAGFRWRSPIHMPRWACRLTLSVLDVRVQRLHSITEMDARAEGLEPDPPRHWYYTPNTVSKFAVGWDRLNGHRSPWIANDWVYAITFRVAEDRTPHA